MLREFTGIAPYEPPIAPELRVNTAELTSQDALRQILVAIGSCGDCAH